METLIRKIQRQVDFMCKCTLFLGKMCCISIITVSHRRTVVPLTFWRQWNVVASNIMLSVHNLSKDSAKTNSMNILKSFILIMLSWLWSLKNGIFALQHVLAKEEKEWMWKKKKKMWTIREEGKGLLNSQCLLNTNESLFPKLTKRSHENLN